VKETKGDKDSEKKEEGKKKEKCVFYPNCTKPECPYFHPTEPCTAFPACPYGKKCRYIHPEIACEYGGMCLRYGCSYVHPTKIKTPCKHGFACKQKYTTCGYIHPAESCRFGFFCKKKGKCPYSHAKPCNFGSECRIIGCSYSHTSNDSSQQINNEEQEKLSLSLPLTPPNDENQESIKMNTEQEDNQEIKENGDNQQNKTDNEEKEDIIIDENESKTKKTEEDKSEDSEIVNIDD